MTKEDFVLDIKRAAALFGSDGPDIGKGSRAEWVTAYNDWLAKLAKLEVDTKRSQKARKEAADLRAKAEAAGLALVHREELVEQYDTDLAKWRGRAEAAEAEVAKLKGE